jgi:hypothetical protein
MNFWVVTSCSYIKCALPGNFLFLIFTIGNLFKYALIAKSHQLRFAIQFFPL